MSTPELPPELLTADTVIEDPPRGWQRLVERACGDVTGWMQRPEGMPMPALRSIRVCEGHLDIALAQGHPVDQGHLDAIRAISTETCDQCGAKGDPVDDTRGKGAVGALRQPACGVRGVAHPSRPCANASGPSRRSPTTRTRSPPDSGRRTSGAGGPGRTGTTRIGATTGGSRLCIRTPSPCSCGPTTTPNRCASGPEAPAGPGSCAPSS